MKELFVHTYTRVTEMNRGFGNPAIVLVDEDLAVHKQALVSQILNIPDEYREHLVALKEMFTCLKNGDIDAAKEESKEARDGIVDVVVFAQGLLSKLSDKVLSNGIDDDVFFNAYAMMMDSGRFLDLQSAMYLLVGTLMDDVTKYVENEEANLRVNTKVLTIGATVAAILYWSEVQYANINEMLGTDYSFKEDFDVVVDSLASRHIKDEADWEATKAYWEENGVPDIQLEGEFPKGICRSMSDQPDAPKGKFLKSISTKKPTLRV